MSEIKNFVIERKDWTKVEFNNNADLWEELKVFWNLDKEEITALKYILDSNKWKDQEIINKTWKSKLLELSKNLEYKWLNQLWINWTLKAVKNRINNILQLKEEKGFSFSNLFKSNSKKSTWENIESNEKVSNNKYKDLMDLISLGEWTKNNPNVMFWYKKINLFSMTIEEVINYQEKIKWHTAMWKYQIKKSTLKTLINKFPPNTKMTLEIQDKMAIILLKRRWIDKYIRGTKSEKYIIKKLAQEWASIPTNNWKSYYDNDKAWNHSRVKLSKVQKVLRDLKN